MSGYAETMQTILKLRSSPIPASPLSLVVAALSRQQILRRNCALSSLMRMVCSTGIDESLRSVRRAMAHSSGRARWLKRGRRLGKIKCLSLACVFRFMLIFSIVVAWTTRVATIVMEVQEWQVVVVVWLGQQTP